jgi:cytochrome c oxidase assembly protein subunit 15
LNQTTHIHQKSRRKFDNNQVIASWLFVLSAMVLVMVSIGGITRLTGSGLSMVEWRPLIGFFPPFSESEWLRVFNLYKASPQYQEINSGISLAGFKSIFWWEFIHRLWGRLIGAVFLLPFLWFLFKKKINLSIAPRLILLFFLGGAQGVLGWYMVQSGLINEPEVSQYRLAAHLLLALALYIALFWTALQLRFPHSEERQDQKTRGIVNLARLTFFIIAITILSGAFVAGTDAGFAYNTFPLMDGKLIPSDYLPRPWFTSTFEDIATIQFNHRILAILSLFIALITWWRSRWVVLVQRARNVANGLLIAIFLQVALGITTLILAVPTPLAATHQVGAVLLLTMTAWFIFELNKLK